MSHIIGVTLKEHPVQYQSPGQEARPTTVYKVYNFFIPCSFLWRNMVIITPVYQRLSYNDSVKQYTN